MKETQETLSDNLIPSNKQSQDAQPQLNDPKNKKLHEQYFSRPRFLFGDNIIQTIFFTWISPLMTYGYKIPIDEKAIPQLKDAHKPNVDFIKLSEKLQKNFKDNRSKRQGLTLTKSIFSVFKKQFALVGIFCLIIVSGQMYSPILSHQVIEYIDSQKKQTWKGIQYFLSIFVINIFVAISQTFLFYYLGILGFNLSNTLSLLIYNKALKHPLITQKQFAIGDIINYSQVDAERMTSLSWNLASLAYFPFLIVFALVLLYIYIGISFLAGVGIMIILMICTLFISRIANKGNDELLKAKDARMKAAEQILNIIKFIKINALQKFFFQKVNKKRQSQLRLIKKVNLCYVCTIFMYWLCPPIIVSMTFLLFISLGNQISAPKAFLTIIIFNILQFPIRMLPSAISDILQIWASVKRIEKFLRASELNVQCIQQDTKKGQKYAIEIERGYFLWGKQKEDKDKKKDQQKSDEKQKEKQKQQKEKEKNKIHQKNKKKANKNNNKRKISQSNDAISQSFDSVSEVNSQQKFKQSLLSDQQKDSILLSLNSDDVLGEKKFQKFIKVLQGIDIKFPSGQTTMIIGDIGSGKSSLLYAILNQMTPEPQRKSRIKINGTIAYSPQKAWIMAGTVKDNITFFQPYDEKRFKQVIHYACLTDDIKMLNDGINTEIGQKGANLSGGQKARISLARALYSNKDIYLLDDILSAVDVHVGNFIMQKTILQYLKGKTVIMPTHAIKYLERSDNIIIMKKGKVIANGPYKHINDCEQFQQILKLEQKKMSEKVAEKPEDEQQKIVNQLKLIKQATKSKQKSKQKEQGVEIKNSESQYTDQIVEQLIMPEDHHRGSVSYKVYLEYIKLNGGPLFAVSVIFCMSVWTVMSVLSNIQVQNWCQDENKQIKYLYLYLVLAISASVFSGVRAYVLVTSGIQQGRTIHKKMIKSLLYASLTRFYNRVPVGRILNRLSKDLREVDEALGYAVGNILICIFSTLGNLVMCIYASTPLVVLPILITSYLFQKILKYYLKSQRQCVRMEKITTSPIVSGFTSTVNGVATIRAYGLQSQFLKNQIEKIDINKRMRITREAMQSWLSLRLALASFLINISALAYSIFWNDGSGNASLIGLLLTYSVRLNDDIIGLAFGYSNLQLRMISIERVSTFTKIQPEMGYVQYCENWRTKQEGANLLAITDGRIEFQNYSTRYRDKLPLVLQNLNLVIEKGRKVGIVGRTGAGKSTLINCILRILQSASGSIRIDGVPLPNYKLKDLRACMTMIEQQPTLLNGSFRQNLDPTNKYSEEQITQIIKKCNLAELVQSKGGLDSKITNENLSVGQKQLICICRAFLKNSKIILIDEATANIDVKNDKLIQQVISTAFKTSTVLTIAHRLSTIKNCDQIVVLNEGKIIQQGDTSELIKKPNGIYRKMCEQNDNTYLL